jgi:hypothetical protein
LVRQPRRFNDYPWWGGGEYALVWRNSDKSRIDLGHQAMAAWLEENSRRCHVLNRPSVLQRLNRAQRKQGPTLFDWLVEIIHGNEHVELRLE